MSERLVRDGNLVEVYAPAVAADGPFRARAFVTTSRIVVWREGPDRVPVLVVDSAHGRPEPEMLAARDRGSFKGQLRFETADAGTVHLTGARGCACGSPLKALSPPVPW